MSQRSLRHCTDDLRDFLPIAGRVGGETATEADKIADTRLSATSTPQVSGRQNRHSSRSQISPLFGNDNLGTKFPFGNTVPRRKRTYCTKSLTYSEVRDKQQCRPRYNHHPYPQIEETSSRSQNPLQVLHYFSISWHRNGSRCSEKLCPLGSVTRASTAVSGERFETT